MLGLVLGLGPRLVYQARPSLIEMVWLDRLGPRLEYGVCVCVCVCVCASIEESLAGLW